MHTGASSRFALHWDWVAQVPSRPGWRLAALWPSPVNADAWFEAAGFTDFDDADAPWDTLAEAWLQRLIQALSALGTPALRSAPLQARRAWWQRWHRPTEPLPLPQQLLMPMHWDSLPARELHFGDSGVVLRTGQGHWLCWLHWPEDRAAELPALLLQLADGHPLHRTPLAWQHLQTDHHGQARPTA
jgi:hypothetical protein